MRKLSEERDSGKRESLTDWRRLLLRLVMTVFLLGVKDWGQSVAYAGEFGGFDVDIGADEGILDNWEDEPEADTAPVPGASDPGSSDPEQKENPGSGEGNYESANNSSKTENVQEKIENSTGGANSAENNTKNNTAAVAPANKNTENKNTKTSTDEKSSEKNLNSNNSSSENNVSARQNGSKNEEKPGDNTAERSESTVKEKKEAAQKKEEKAKSEITEHPKEEITKPPKEDTREEHLKYTAAGTVFTAVGMAKISPEFKFYNSNDENKEKYKKTDENNNKTIQFEHIEIVLAGEYPEIQIIRSAAELDVTILSLRLNGEEVFWHQQGDTLILDQPITEKKNTVKLLAAVDGRRIVQMAIWEF